MHYYFFNNNNGLRDYLSIFLSYNCLICAYGLLTGIKVDTNKQTSTHHYRVNDTRSIFIAFIRNSACDKGIGGVRSGGLMM